MAHAMDAGIQREIRSLPGNTVRQAFESRVIWTEGCKMEANMELPPTTND